MIEYILAGMGVIAMTRVAESDGRSTFTWGFASLAIMIAAWYLLPIAFLRVVVGVVAIVVLMMITKAMGGVR